jgi:hypothetical protein
MHLFGPHTYLEDDLEQGIFETWKWLTRRFGDVLRNPLVTPTPEFFPSSPLTGDAMAKHVLQRVRHLLRTDVACEVWPIEAEGLTPDQGGPSLITYTDATQPWLLVSELAHGVAALMLTPLRDELPEGDDSFWPAISLLVVHKGFGIFALNARTQRFTGGKSSRTYECGNLSEQTFAFTLAIYLALTDRIGAADAWIKPGAIDLLHDAQKYLAKNPDLLSA